LLTFWPPGPLERMNLSSRSSSRTPSASIFLRRASSFWRLTPKIGIVLQPFAGPRRQLRFPDLALSAEITPIMLHLPPSDKMYLGEAGSHSPPAKKNASPAAHGARANLVLTRLPRSRSRLLARSFRQRSAPYLAMVNQHDNRLAEIPPIGPGAGVKKFLTNLLHYAKLFAIDGGNP